MEEDFKKMILQLKHKFDDTEKVVQVLTVLPQSWSIRRIQEEFGAVYHTARLSKQLATSEGIMATPMLAWGKCSLKLHVEEKVVAFYLSNIVSWMLPGKKDYVSMYIQGKKEKAFTVQSKGRPFAVFR